MKKFAFMNKFLCISFAIMLGHNSYGMLGNSEFMLSVMPGESRVDRTRAELNNIKITLQKRELDRQKKLITAEEEAKKLVIVSTEHKKQFLNILARIINKDAGCEAIIASRIFPFIKHVSVSTRGITHIFTAECDDEYLQSEVFNRMSAFASCSYLKPSDISIEIIQSSVLNDVEKQKFADIVHALRPGQIKLEANTNLVMKYADEEIE